jgi:hypothetical protein
MIIYKKSFWNLTEYKYKRQFIETLIFSLIAFFLPTILAHPQWLIGIIVNFMLFRAAIHLKGLQLLPIIILPSLGVFTAGLIFGNLTNFLLYFIPFIWIGNALYIFTYKYLKLKKNLNFPISLTLSVILKVIIIFVPAVIAVYFLNFPKIFLTAMGLLQVITATIGGLAAYYSIKLQNRLKI